MGMRCVRMLTTMMLVSRWHAKELGKVWQRMTQHKVCKKKVSLLCLQSSFTKGHTSAHASSVAHSHCELSAAL